MRASNSTVVRNASSLNFSCGWEAPPNFLLSCFIVLLNDAVGEGPHYPIDDTIKTESRSSHPLANSTNLQFYNFLTQTLTHKAVPSPTSTLFSSTSFPSVYATKTFVNSIYTKYSSDCNYTPLSISLIGMQNP